MEKESQGRVHQEVFRSGHLGFEIHKKKKDGADCKSVWIPNCPCVDRNFGGDGSHIEEGHRWDEALERKFAMCKRALKRDNGPEKRAQEVKLEDIPTNAWAKVSDEKAEPRRIARVFAWAVIWMLRSIEVY